MSIVTDNAIPLRIGPPPEGGSPDPYRGVSPELVDRLERSLDERLGEMFTLCRDGKPIRGRKLRRLETIARLMRATIEKFLGEVVEPAL